MTDNYVSVHRDDFGDCQCDTCFYYDTFEFDDSPCNDCIYCHPNELSMYDEPSDLGNAAKPKAAGR